ncbi:MAG: cysteine desulfurase [Candidatus Saccharibacteria bacterium]|nr:cysteine desulfurase [Candidatus Saccharibacteria bacterium]
MIYLDSAATSPILPSVKKAIIEAMDELYANPSELYTSGHLVADRIKKAREKVAELINADPSEIIFTSGASESNNTVIRTFEGESMAVSSIDHHSVIVPAEKYASPLTPVKIDKNGLLCYNEDIWTSRPKLVSIGLANNEIGVIQDVSFWAEKAHKNGALIHSDLTQAVGKIPVDVKELDLDYASFSGHKIGTPKGIGVLYVKKGSPLKPLILGGNQEKKRRAGTENTLGIIALEAAADYILTDKTWELYAERVKPLRDKLAQSILDNIEGSSLNPEIRMDDMIGSHGDACSRPSLRGELRFIRSPLVAGTPLEPYPCPPCLLPNILNVSFEAAEGESIQLYLDLEGIAVSTGSACATGEPSHVITALTNDIERAHSSIRFSLGLDTTEKDIEKVINVLPGIIKKLQGISTIKMKGVK